MSRATRSNLSASPAGTPYLRGTALDLAVLVVHACTAPLADPSARQARAVHEALPRLCQPTPACHATPSGPAQAVLRKGRAERHACGAPPEPAASPPRLGGAHVLVVDGEDEVVLHVPRAAGTAGGQGLGELGQATARGKSPLAAAGAAARTGRPGDGSDAAARRAPSQQGAGTPGNADARARRAGLTRWRTAGLCRAWGWRRRRWGGRSGAALTLAPAATTTGGAAREGRRDGADGQPTRERARSRAAPRLHTTRTARAAAPASLVHLRTPRSGLHARCAAQCCAAASLAPSQPPRRPPLPETGQSSGGTPPARARPPSAPPPHPLHPPPPPPNPQTHARSGSSGMPPAGRPS